MPTTEIDNGLPTMRPKSLTASSLMRRASVGLFILVAGTVASVWLYDASLKANALGQVTVSSSTSDQ